MGCGLQQTAIGIVDSLPPVSVTPGIADTPGFPLPAGERAGWIIYVLTAGVMGSNGTLDMKLQESTNGSAFTDSGLAVTQLTQAGGDSGKSAMLAIRAADLPGTVIEVRARTVAGTAASMAAVLGFYHDDLGLVADNFALLDSRAIFPASLGDGDNDCACVFAGVATMIASEDVRLWMPREGAMSLLTLAKNAMCVGCDDTDAPPDFDVYLALVANNPPLAAGLTRGDLTLVTAVGGTPIQLNGEASPGFCDGMIEGPAEGLDGEWRLVIDQQIFAYASGDPESVYAVALLIVDAGGSLDDATILGYGNLALGPAPFGTVGDVIKITGQFILEPLLPPAVPEVPE